MPIQCVLFDYGMVLCPEQNVNDVEELARMCGLSMEAFLPRYHESRVAYDRGDFDGVEYWRQFVSRIGLTLERETHVRLNELDTRSWEAYDEELIALMAELRASGIKTGILSNMAPDQSAHFRRIHPWVEQCDHLFFSGEVGLLKPDPKLYRFVADAVGLAPEEIAFLDDRPANAESASAFGYRGILFDSKARALAELRRLLAK